MLKFCGAANVELEEGKKKFVFGIVELWVEETCASGLLIKKAFQLLD